MSLSILLPVFSSLVVFGLMFLQRTEIRLALSTIGTTLREAVYSNPFIFAYAIILLSYTQLFPLSFDEAYTFKQYTTRNLYQTFFTYLTPNNHILSSILTWGSWKLFHWIPGPFAVRLPALLASLGTFLLIQHHFLKRSPFYSGILLVSLICTSNLFQFSFMARGYALHSFFAIISLILIQQSKAPFKTRFVGFMICSFFALYTNPAYLFTAVTLGFYFLFHSFPLFKQNLPFILLSTLSFALLTYLGYSPIIYHEGLNALIGNEYVLPQSNIDAPFLWSYLHKLIDFLFFPTPVALLIPILFLLLIVFQKKYTYAIIIIVPCLMMFALKQFPSYIRVLLPFSMLMLTICLHQICYQFPVNFRPAMQYTIVSILALITIPLGLYHFEHHHQKNDFNTAFYLRRINNEVANAQTVYTHDVYWHLKFCIDAQKVYNKHKWQPVKKSPTTLHQNEYLISSSLYPHFHCIDTFNLHNGIAYLYKGAN